MAHEIPGQGNLGGGLGNHGIDDDILTVGYDPTITGGLVVVGKGKLTIPFRFNPRNPTCFFADNPPIPGCGPLPDDRECDNKVKAEGPPWRRRYYLELSWDVGDQVSVLIWQVER